MNSEANVEISLNAEDVCGKPRIDSNIKVELCRFLTVILYIITPSSLKCFFTTVPTVLIFRYIMEVVEVFLSFVGHTKP